MPRIVTNSSPKIQQLRPDFTSFRWCPIIKTPFVTTFRRLSNVGFKVLELYRIVEKNVISSHSHLADHRIYDTIDLPEVLTVAKKSFLKVVVPYELAQMHKMSSFLKKEELPMDFDDCGVSGRSTHDSF